MTKKDLSQIAPPPRRSAAVPATSTTAEHELVACNVRITADRATYLRLLSAKTRVSQRELIERAIDLLREQAGEI